MESLSELLNQLKLLENKINNKINDSKIVTKYYKKFHFDKDVYIEDRYNEFKEEYRKTIDYTKSYFLVTLTFDPKISNNLDLDGQFIKLTHVLDLMLSTTYYMCYEKHKSEILHCHIMVSDIEYHKLEKILHEGKKHITKSKHLRPAIKIDAIKQSVSDLNNTYNYIWDDKKDHPKYKYIRISI